MRFKIDPEVIRLVQMVTAGIMGMTAVLTGTNAIPPVALVWVVAFGAFLQGFGTAYTQGQQTEPPHGMVTEDYARKDEQAHGAERGPAKGEALVEPHPWPPEYEQGRATVPVERP